MWEQSFPAVGGISLPVSDPRTGRVALVRLTRRQAEARRVANEARLRSLLRELVSLGLDPLVIGTSDPHDVDRALVGWAELRRRGRWLR